VPGTILPIYCPIKQMLYNLGVWMVGLVLACPVLAILTACAHAPRFYKRSNIPSRKRTFYRTAIVLSLTCAVAYLGYWVWLFCKLYSVSVSLTFSLWLERCMYASVIVAAIAVVCLYMGRGPYRAVVALSAGWIAAYCWLHLPIIHWA
jgi:hypothetical protein